MAKVSISGSTARSILANGLSIKLVDSVHTSGLTVAFTRDSGETTTCMVEECIRGAMAESTKETIKMIRSTDKAPMYGLTVVPTLAAGRMENNMEQESTSRAMEPHVKEFGLMESVVTGPMRFTTALNDRSEESKSYIFRL